MEKKHGLMVALMLAMLFVLRGTRTPNETGLTVLLWALSFFVVAFTLATFKFPRMRWTHLGASACTLVLLLIPPVTDSWLSGIPDVVPAFATLAYLSVLATHAVEKVDIPVKGGKASRVSMNLDDLILGLTLLWIGSAPELLGRFIGGQLASAIEWDGAWAPVLGAVPVLFLLAMYSLVRRGLQRSLDPSPVDADGGAADA